MTNFSDTCERYLRDVYCFFTYRLGSRADAEDLTQQTFERAFRAWPRYDPARAGVRTWLLAIAGNLLIDHYRSRGLRHEHPLDGDPGVLAPDEAPEFGLDPALATALELLGGREREIIALRFGADLTGPEIAGLTGLTLANVQQILSRSLRRLRMALDDEDSGWIDRRVPAGRA